jgi:uncharacterized protein (DUF2126 family)
MVASAMKPADLDKHQATAVASLSEKLHLPLHQVREAYLKELDRLQSQARIHRFVAVLALSSTRSALSSGKAERSTSAPPR